ncbi:hypothetical protein LEP1GSC133_1803 [Leptospira borgpetersenii serovar Pomona str. 200901868]|uniref:Uncharacterized protein n=1 Tax=Leptospira borgpetersenii serovar Pomona str. 200901868 TaxID=1192866 RepID=M6VYP0_LEPBO|nr:hypothetical protein LEP1GSC133_1803 [Leptospira borgpetersenii serovar Pomona str. 200901868]
MKLNVLQGWMRLGFWPDGRVIGKIFIDSLYLNFNVQSLCL